MDICPHCGEPIDEDARSCPHCGSDEETGWKPDADDYSFELPNDDFDTEESRRRTPVFASIPELRWEEVGGLLWVVGAVAVFAWVGRSADHPAWIPVLVLLVVGLVGFWLWLRGQPDL